MTDFIYQVDFSVLNFIQEHLSCAFLDAFFPIYTQLGGVGGLFCILLAALMLWFPRTRRMGCVMGGALLVGVLTANAVLKPAVGRVRPYANTAWNPLRTVGGESELAGSRPLLVRALKDGSFPSGHSAAVTETAGGILCFRRRWGLVAAGLALLVAYSRLYLYVHYFTDVLAGIAVGAAATVVAYIAEEYYWPLLPAFVREESVPQLIRRLRAHLRRKKAGTEK